MMKRFLMWRSRAAAKRALWYMSELDYATAKKELKLAHQWEGIAKNPDGGLSFGLTMAAFVGLPIVVFWFAFQ